MQNYIKAIKEFLENDPEVAAYTSNVHFLRVPKWQDKRPFILFTEDPRKNPYDMESWKDIFNVSFECVVDYWDTVKWREMRELLKKKFSSFHGKIGGWTWTIWYLEDLKLGYDDKNDVVSWWSMYLFKSFRDL